MKRYSLTALILSLFAGIIFTACDSDDSDYLVASRDCIIQNIVLGSLECPRTVKDSKGNDSTYIAVIPGVKYPMSIDQLNGKIYNPDSLPKGTDLTKVCMSTLAVTGYTTIKSLVTGEDTLLTINDTIDYSQPRTVTVHATDRRYSRNYVIELLVHNEEPDTINWQNLTATPSAMINQFADCNVMAIENDLYVFGQMNDGSSQMIATSTISPNFDRSTMLQTADGKAIDVRSIQHLGETFYGLSEGKVCCTNDLAQPWVNTESNMAHFDAIAACSTDSLYALEGDKIFASADGQTWYASATDTDGQWPTENLTSTLLHIDQQNGNSMLIVAGNRGNERVVWQHLFEKNKYYEYPWMFMPQTEELKGFGYPNLKQASMITYDKKPLLFGLTLDTQKPVFYQSEDSGRTWKIFEMKYPEQTQTGTTRIAVDDNHFVWSINCGTGQVFKGRHNRLGWANYK